MLFCFLLCHGLMQLENRLVRKISEMQSVLKMLGKPSKNTRRAKTKSNTDLA